MCSLDMIKILSAMDTQLPLSDYSAPYLSWRSIHASGNIIQSLFMELVNQHQRALQYPKRICEWYTTSVQCGQMLNIRYLTMGFQPADHFDFSYLNPVIFLVAAQQENGSPDKPPWTWLKAISLIPQVYGQLLINELCCMKYCIIQWMGGNKHGLQLGLNTSMHLI